MTGQLRTTLYTRADDLESWDVDLDTIVRDGHRRLRRRRVAVAGTVAGVLAVAGGVTLAARGHATRPQPADGDAHPLSYAVGSVIHSGAATVDVGIQVESLVRTTRGFVFTDPQLRVYEEKDGDVHLIRSFDEAPAHADADSPLDVSDDGRVAVWWDGERFQSYPGYVLDGKADSFSAARTWSHDAPPTVRGISGGHLFFWNGRRTMIAEVQPTRSTAFWPDLGLSGPQVVQDAAGDRVLVRVGDGMAVVKANLRPLDADLLSAWKPGTELSGVRPQVPVVTTGDLSPDGDHWFTADGNDRDEFEVFDSDTGQAQAPTYRSGHVTPYAWLGDDTIAGWTVPTDDPNGPVTLLTCQVSTNTCSVAARDIGAFGSIAISGQPSR